MLQGRTTWAHVVAMLVTQADNSFVSEVGDQAEDETVGAEI